MEQTWIDDVHIFEKGNQSRRDHSDNSPFKFSNIHFVIEG